MDNKGTTNTKEDIRRMMRQTAARMQQSSGTRAASGTAATSMAGSGMATEGADESVKGHPFARYNSLNQLTCILCGCIVKSTLLWRTHLSSKQHRTNAEALKSRGGDRAVDILSGAGIKRRLESAQQKLQEQKQKQQQQQGGLGLTYSDEEGDEAEQAVQPQLKMKRPSDVPAMALSGKVRRQQDFPSLNENPSRQEQHPQQQLPEGFFDDPVADARARNVPYKDKMEEELELFAREMRETQAESEQIAEAAEEVADNVRYLEEIIVQEETWSRLNELEILKEAAAVKQEVAASVKAEPAGGGGDLKKPGGEAEESDNDEEDELNWRKKKL